MKLLPIFGLLALIAVAYAIDCGKESSEEEDEKEFDEIAKKNKDLWNKINHDQSKKQGFAFRAKTDQDRKQRFKEKAKEAKEHNKKGDSKFCRKANEMDALDDDEIQNEFLGLDVSEVKAEEWPEAHHGFGSDRVLANLPSHVDHSDATGPVESQGGCGSCWAFAASHTLTGVVAKVGSKSVNDYSEQQITDCTYQGKGGCEGGWMDRGWNYLKNKNLAFEKDYPYTGKSTGRSCRDSSVRGSPFVTGSVKIKGEAEMRKVVAKHPISLAMLVGKGGFGSYKSGVYDYNGGDCNSLNHAMTIVGYGSENGDDYWLVKNSWGKNWGNNGYIKIKRGKNLCNIEKYAMYPTVKAGGGGSGGGGGDDSDDGGPSWKTYKTMKYIYPNHAQDFELAEQYCLQQGSHLPTVDSDSKNSDLSDLVRNKLGESSVWIGANSRQGRWGWTDTSKSFSYTRWNSGQPGSSQCGYLSGSRWSAGSCHSNKKYVCVKFGEGGGDDSDDGNDGGGDCKDKNKDCSHWTQLCNSNDYVKKNCDKTCGRCGSNPTNSPTTTRGNCVNKYSNCNDYKSRCGRGDWVDKDCQCTCKGSDGGGGNCKNKYSNCDDYKSRCGRGDWVDTDCQCTCKGSSGGGGNCKNKYTNCDDFKNQCGRGDWVDKDCQCTCGTGR